MPPEPEADPKAKKAAKPKAGDPPPPPRLLEAWTGPHSVYVVEVIVVLLRLHREMAVELFLERSTVK